MDGPRDPGVEGIGKEHASRLARGVVWIAWIVATGSSFLGPKSGRLPSATLIRMGGSR